MWCMPMSGYTVWLPDSFVWSTTSHIIGVSVRERLLFSLPGLLLFLLHGIDVGLFDGVFTVNIQFFERRLHLACALGTCPAFEIQQTDQVDVHPAVAVLHYNLLQVLCRPPVDIVVELLGQIFAIDDHLAEIVG